MPSFDAVSKVDWSEFKNALTQAEREVAQRFDFRGTNTSLEQNDSGIVIHSETDDRAAAALLVLEEKLIRRKVSLKHLEKKKPERGSKGQTRLVVLVKEGIEVEKAREIVKLVKDSKLKVTAAIQEDAVRITGKKRDDLQAAMHLLRSTESLDLDLQFINFRD